MCVCSYLGSFLLVKGFCEIFRGSKGGVVVDVGCIVDSECGGELGPELEVSLIELLVKELLTGFGIGSVFNSQEKGLDLV